MIVYHQIRGFMRLYGANWMTMRGRTKPPAAGGGLFMEQPNLNGLNVGGPFFANPIG